MEHAQQLEAQKAMARGGALLGGTAVLPRGPAATEHDEPVRARISREHGQGMLELAIMLPIWIALVVGMVDLARVYNAYSALQNVAREGARYGSSHPLDTTGIQIAAAREVQNSGLSIATSNITVSCPAGACVTGNPIQVTASYDAPLLTTYIAGLSSITLRATAQFVVL